MSRLFDPKKMHKLDNPKRRKNLPPEATLRRLGLLKGDVMLDLGCGIGYFTLPAAQVASRVIAVDRSDEMLEALEDEARKQGVEGIERWQADAASLPIPDHSVDFTLVVNVLHEVEDLHEALTEMMRVTKRGGRIGIVEFLKKKTPDGPSLGHRLDADDLIDALEPYGIDAVERLDLTDSLYGLAICRKGSHYG